MIDRAVQAVVASFEARAFRCEHQPGDLKRLVEAVHTLPHRREIKAVAAMLVRVPGCTEAQNGAASGDDVERRNDFCQQGRIAVRDARNQCCEADPGRATGQRGEGGVRLEHRLRLGTDGADLIEVVHHRHEVEIRALGSLGKPRELIK